METFIGFFDVLGFKEIVYNNSLDDLKGFFDHLLRDSQTALSGGTFVQVGPGAIVPELKNQKVNCLHVSDSIIFWTRANTVEDFKDLVSVCYSFYWTSLGTTFPLRGCLTFGEIDFDPDTIRKISGVAFFNYSLFGKGLIDAYLKAESIEYAGCILDELAVEKVGKDVLEEVLLDRKICEYEVPFKAGTKLQYVFTPTRNSYNEQALENEVANIKRLFTWASKADIDTMSESARKKMNNTIKFIGHFRDVDEGSGESK